MTQYRDVLALHRLIVARTGNHNHCSGGHAAAHIQDILCRAAFASLLHPTCTNNSIPRHVLGLTATSPQMLVLEPSKAIDSLKFYIPAGSNTAGSLATVTAPPWKSSAARSFSDSVRCRLRAVVDCLTRARTPVCRAMSIAGRFRVLGESRICLTMEISRASHDRSGEAVSTGVMIALGFFRRYPSDIGYRSASWHRSPVPAGAEG